MLPKLDMYNYRIGASSVVIFLENRSDPIMSDILSELSQSDNRFSLEGRILVMTSVDLGTRDLEYDATPLYLHVEEESLQHVRTEQNAV